jgi:urease accessory protein
MQASACLTVARAQGTCQTRITRLHSDPPLVLRPTRPIGAESFQGWNLHDPTPARVAVAAAAAGPIGGDHLRLGIDVEPGASLVLRNVAATLLLPGPHGQASCTETTVRIGTGGTLVWLPGPVIAAQDCHHHAVTKVMMDAGARLFLREELLLGRHGEQPGTIHQHLRICLGDCPLYDQALAVGPDIMGWDSSAVLGGRRAIGSVLIVDPAWDRDPIDLPGRAVATDTVLMPLSGPGIVITAVARNGLALRRQLDTGIAAIEAAMLQRQ